MKTALVFKGAEDVEMLERIEIFRLDVWSRIIDREVANKRFKLDRFDYDGWHVVYLGNGTIIGCGRLIVAQAEPDVPDLCSFKPYLGNMQFPVGIMNRLVVGEIHSSRGIGNSINVARIDLARKHDASAVWVEIQVERLAAMERLGFVDKGPSLDKTIDGDWRIMCRNCQARVS